MVILEVLHNELGAVLGYKVRRKDNTLVEMSLLEAIRHEKDITNARLVNGVFVPKVKEKDLKVKVKRSNKQFSVLGNNDLILLKRAVQKAPPNARTANKTFNGEGYLNVCKYIRYFAKKGLIQVDKEAHGSNSKGNSGNNLKLFSILKLCSVPIENFVQMYLSNLQPYALHPYTGSMPSNPNSHYWMFETDYCTEIVIKVDVSLNKLPLVVSFHESYLDDTYSKSNYSIDRNKDCLVFVDKVTKINQEKVAIQYFVCKGLMRYSLKSVISSDAYVENPKRAYVSYSEIERKIQENLAKKFSFLRNEYYENEVEVRSRSLEIEVKKHSFWSYGTNKLNMFCFLIDLYSYVKSRDVSSREEIIAIVEFLCDNSLSELGTIVSILSERYKDTNNELYFIVLKYYNELKGVV